MMTNVFSFLQGIKLFIPSIIVTINFLFFLLFFQNITVLGQPSDSNSPAPPVPKIDTSITQNQKQALTQQGQIISSDSTKNTIPLPSDTTIRAVRDTLRQDSLGIADTSKVEEISKEDTAKVFKAFIVMPEYLDVFSTGIAHFIASAFGPFSSLIKNEAFEWTSNIDGSLGKGKELVVVHLTPGVHKINLRVKNQRDEIGADSIYCLVQNQYIDTPPEVVNAPRIPGFQERIEGELLLGIHLNESGKPSDVKIVENTTQKDSLGDLFVERALKSTYSPAREGQIPRTSWILQGYFFESGQTPIEVVARAPEVLLAAKRDEINFLKLKAGGGISGELKSYSRNVDENSQKVLAVLFPNRLLPIPLRLTKNKKSLTGEIASAIKINRMGLVTALIILDNTTNESWVEEDFIKIMLESVFEPMYDPAGPNERTILSLFKIEGNKLIPQDIGDETVWQERYPFQFPSIEKGGEPEFAQEPKVRITNGYFRLLLTINEKGKAKDIKEIAKYINEEDVKKLVEKTYKKDTFIPAQVKGTPKRSYLCPTFSFQNVDNSYYLQVLRSYNNSYYYFIRGENKKAISNFERVSKSDMIGDYIGTYEQSIYCMEKEKRYDKAFRLYQDGIRKFAYIGNLTAMDRLSVELDTLKKAYSTNHPFYELMYGQNPDLFRLYTFLPPTSLARLKGQESGVLDAPNFPEKIKRSGVEGTTTLAVMVDNNGMVKEVDVQKNFGELVCDREALKSAKRKEYQSATIGSDPVTSWIQVQMPFRYFTPILQSTANQLPLQTAPRPDSLLIQPGLPAVIYQGLNQFSKANEKTTGDIRTALKFNNSGWITDIIIMENKISNDKDKAESELVELLSQSLFNPVTLVKDSSSREIVYVATFEVQEKTFALPQDNRSTIWASKDKIIFPTLTEGTEPDFSQSEDSAEVHGAFNYRYKITPEGKIRNFTTLYKNVNKGKYIDQAKKTIEFQAYSPAKIGDSVKTAYKINGFGFRSFNQKIQISLIKKYNEGYKKLVKGDYSGAAGSFEEIIRKDRTGEFLSLLPQTILCYKNANVIHKGYELFNDLIRQYSLMQDTSYQALATKYVSLRYQAVIGNDIYAILTDTSSPKAIYALPSPGKNPVLMSDLETLWKTIEYPRKEKEKIRYGTAEIIALINEKGEVKSIEFMHSLGDKDYDERAKKIVRKNASFSPAEYQGQPVQFWCRIPIKFEEPIFSEDVLPWIKKPSPKVPPKPEVPVDSMGGIAGKNDSLSIADSTGSIFNAQDFPAIGDSVSNDTIQSDTNKINGNKINTTSIVGDTVHEKRSPSDTSRKNNLKNTPRNEEIILHNKVLRKDSQIVEPKKQGGKKDTTSRDTTIVPQDTTIKRTL